MRKTRNLLTILLVSAAPLWAVETVFWQVSTYEEFFQGTLRDVSLTKEGRLRLAPEAKAIFNPEETLALSLATDKNRNIFIGTGHQGKVFKVDSGGKGSLFFTAREPEIFALATASDGAVVVGSSPEGKIYRVDPDGKSTVFYDPKSKYIWALAFDGKGNLYAGTGDQGRIHKIDPSGKGEVFYDTKQTHVMCLMFDRTGNLLAGSVPNGLVYRIDPQAKGFVIYQASYPEIHDLALDSEGRIYAAALGGPGGKATPDLFPGAAPAGPVQAPVTTVTVTAATDGTGKESKEVQAPGQPQGTVSTGRPAPQATPFPSGQIPQGRGALIVIRPDQTVETVWSSNNESIFGLAIRQENVMFSTDSNGRIFELAPTKDGQRLTLLAQTRESLATRLLLQGPDLYIATSNIAKLFRVTEGSAKEGTYESPVRDTKFVSRWGKLAWGADLPAGSSLEFFSRSGNSDRPDQTWSDWAGPYKNPEGSPIQSPPARFLQWKAAFKSATGKGPDLNEVIVSYLNQNLPPLVRSVSVSTAGERSSPAGSTSGSSGGAISVTVTPSGGSSSTMAGKSGTVLSWQAEDPNGDQLTYSVHIQATDEQEWHLLKDKLRQTNYSIEASSLADGKYVARVVASDEESNPPDQSRKGELLSAPFWVDNTPPTVAVLRTEATASGVQVQFQVQDAGSPLRHAETLLDALEWRDIVSDDGIVDARQEAFTINLEKLAPGEHIVTLRAFDAAGNAGVGKAIVRIPAGPGAAR
jgi:sugar lactone lactonase YvrE